jgi:hypothetical protein
VIGVPEGIGREGIGLPTSGLFVTGLAGWTTVWRCG